MTAPSAAARVGRLEPGDVPALRAALQSVRFGGTLANQHLLDALDHDDCERFLVWPSIDPVTVAYLGPQGTVIASGDPDGAAALSVPVERSGWRVLIGDAPVCRMLLDVGSRPLRRRPRSREQRFMVASGLIGPVEANLRRAASDDLDVLTDFACRLHVEDRMGPPLSRTGAAAVRSRMMDSITRGMSWVIEHDHVVVGKVDLSMSSPRWGAQIAGVYVEHDWRGRGLATRAVARITAGLLDEGLPGVTLHVRADNQSAIAAYRRAGFADRAPWILALR